jgi:hypothetical protein
MRKLITLSAAAFLIGMIGGAQATPLSAAGAATNGAIEQALPDQGASKAWYRGRHFRHYGWYRGHHYGWRHRHAHRYAWHRY